MLLTLPPELLYEVISHVLPPTSDAILPPSSSTTKDLLTLTLVFKKTQQIANKLLIKRCVYLNSDKATGCLANGLLTRFCRANKDQNGLVLEPNQAIIHIRTVGRPERRSIRIDLDVTAFDAFFWRVGHCLTRLVHICGSYWHHQFPEWTQAREAFKQLLTLEELYCAGFDGDIYGETESQGLSVWSHCTRLRRLALYRAHPDSTSFLIGLQSLQSLTHLFLYHPLPYGRLVSLTECYGLEKVQNILVVELDYGFEREVEISMDEFENTFLERMKALRLEGSTNTPERILIMTLVVEDDDDTRWFLERVQDGSLWDLQETGNLRRELEI